MESKSLTNELIDLFGTGSDMPSASAFVQQRNKVKAEAFKDVFEGFTSNLISSNKSEFQVLAVDGSDIQIATNPDDTSSFFLEPMVKSHIIYCILMLFIL